MSSEKRVSSASEVQSGDQCDMSNSYSNVSLNKVTLRAKKGKKRRLSTVDEDLSNQISSFSFLNQNSFSPEGTIIIASTSNIASTDSRNTEDRVTKRRKKSCYLITESGNSYLDLNKSCIEERQCCETDNQPLCPDKKLPNKKKRKHNSGQENVIDDKRGTVTISYYEGENKPEAGTFESDIKESRRKTKKHKKKRNHECDESLIESEIENVLNLSDKKVGSTLEKNTFDNVKNDQLEKCLKANHKKYYQNANEEILDKKPLLEDEELLQDTDSKECKKLDVTKSLKSKNKKIKKKFSGNDVGKSVDLCGLESLELSSVSKSTLSPPRFSQLESSVSNFKDPYHSANSNMSCSPKYLKKKSKDANRHNKPHSPDNSTYSTEINLQENGVQNDQELKSIEHLDTVKKPKKTRKRSSMLLVNKSPDSQQKYNDNKKETNGKEDVSKQLQKLGSSKSNIVHENETKSKRKIFISEKFNIENKHIMNKKSKYHKDLKTNNNNIPKLDIEQIQQDLLAKVLRIKGSHYVQSNKSLISDNCKLEKTTLGVKSKQDRSSKNKIANTDQSEWPTTGFNKSKDVLHLNLNKNSTAHNNLFDVNKIKQDLIAAAFKSINKPQTIKKDHPSNRTKSKINHSKPQESVIKKTNKNISKFVHRTQTNSTSELDDNFLDPCLSQDKESLRDTSCKSPGKICLPDKSMKLKSKSIKESNFDIEKVQQELYDLALKNVNTKPTKCTQSKLHESDSSSTRPIKNLETKIASGEPKNVIKMNKSKEKLLDPLEDKTAKFPTKEVKIKDGDSKNVLGKTSGGPNNAIRSEKSKGKILDPSKYISLNLLPEDSQVNKNFKKQSVKTGEEFCDTTKKKKSKVKTKDSSKVLPDEMSTKGNPAKKLNKTNEGANDVIKKKKSKAKTLDMSEDITANLSVKLSINDNFAKTSSKTNEENNDVFKKKKPKVKKLDPIEDLKAKMLSEVLKKISNRNE